VIDLSRVRVVGGAARVLGFPVTARLTAVGFQPGTLSLRSAGAEAWPLVKVSPSDPEPTQAATLWMFDRIDGVWYAAGAERLRPTQTNGPKPQRDEHGRPIPLDTLIGKYWLYDDRWKEMARRNPRPGDLRGFMVVAGSTRSDDNCPLEARSNIIVVEWPGPDGANPCRIVWDEAAPVAPAPSPVPTPLPPPQEPPLMPPPATPTPELDLAVLVPAAFTLLRTVLEKLTAIQNEQAAQRAILAAFSEKQPPTYTGRFLGYTFTLTPAEPGKAKTP